MLPSHGVQMPSLVTHATPSVPPVALHLWLLLCPCDNTPHPPPRPTPNHRRFGVGKRMSIKNTRAIIDAIHSGELEQATCVTSKHFGFQVPTSCTGVPQEVLLPETTWADKAEFDSGLKALAQAFNKNFDKYHVRAPAPAPALFVCGMLRVAVCIGVDVPFDGQLGLTGGSQHLLQEYFPPMRCK